MIDLRCKYCERFLKIEAEGTVIAKVTCPDRKCKKVNNIKIVNGKSSQEDIRYKFKGVIK